MSTAIHATAIIEKGAQIGADVNIGPYCVIGPKVTLGDNVTLKSHVVIEGKTSIGPGTQIYPFASLGLAPQDMKYGGEETALLIGSGNIIREHVTMNPGTVQGGGKTVIGNNGLFMVACHVAHDCMIGDHVIMANNATLGGHVRVGDYAILGGLSAVHQFIRIGEHAVIGGMSGVESDVIPFGRVKGERAFLAGLNLTGLERRGFSKEEMRNLQKLFKELFNDNGTLEERIKDLSRDYKNDNLAMKILDFTQEKTKFPLCRPSKKAA